MKKKIEKILAVWLCVVIFVTVFAVAVPLNVSAYTTHDPIYINGSAGFTAENGVINPDAAGTAIDPYIIEEWEINASYNHGIEIRNTDAYFIIRNCYVYDGRYLEFYFNHGIHFFNVTNSLVENTISSNNYCGIYLDASNNNSISNNEVSKNYRCIYLYHSSYNSISNNNISNNRYGLFLAASNYNIVSNNSAYSNNGGGIGLGSSNYNIVSNNNAYSNSWFGIYLGYSEYNTVSNNIASNNNDGIELWESNYNNIYNNNVSNNEYGINLHYSSNNNNVFNNSASNNDIGILQLVSSNNNIYNNSASNNYYGIYLLHSTNTTLVSNALENNGIFIWGIEIEHFNTHNINPTNTANSKPIYYYKNQNNIYIDGWSSGQVILANCTNFTVKNVDYSNASVGVELAYCSYCSVENSIFNNGTDGISLCYSRYNTIYNNKVSNNYGGIYLRESSYNTISSNTANLNNGYSIYLRDSRYNTISNNKALNNYCGFILLESNDNNILNNNVLNNYYGLYLYFYSSENRVYHNNLINNTQQAYDECTNYWDDGYPSGGNYWSNYTGVDKKSGPNQDQPGSDGIGDTHYNISGGPNRDRYPLMSPWGKPKGPEISVEKEFIPSEITTTNQEVVSAINITNIGDVNITSMTIIDEYVENMRPNDPAELLVTITSDEGQVYAIMPEDLDITSTENNITISFELPLEVVPVYWENGTLQFGEELYYLETIPKDWVVGVQYLLYPLTELEMGIYYADTTVTAYGETGKSTIETATGMLTVSTPLEPIIYFKEG